MAKSGGRKIGDSLLFAIEINRQFSSKTQWAKSKLSQNFQKKVWERRGANRKLDIHFLFHMRYLAPMNPISAFAIFFIIWWVTLFAMLSVGLKTQGETGEVVPGSVESAPARPRFMLVTGLTTLVALLVFAAFYWFAVTRGLRFDNLADFLPGFMRVPLKLQP